MHFSKFVASTRRLISWRDGVLALLASYFLLALPLTPAHAQTEIDLIGTGNLTFLDDNGERIALPIVETSLETKLVGHLAHTTLRQTFFNDTSGTLDGSFDFPLPDTAAVRELVIRFDGRAVRAEIHAKQQAQQIFVEAQQSGHRAGLVEQRQADLFSTRLTNIPGDELVEVELTLLDTMHFDGKAFEYRFPFVMSSRDDTDPVMSTAPLSWSAQVSVTPGFETQTVASRYHEPTRWQQEPGQWRLGFAGNYQSTHDLVITVTPVLGKLPQISTFGERRNGYHYVNTLLLPPLPVERDLLQARELTLVIDKSGSMHGQSMAQAKDAIAWALARLLPGDHFNVIAFDNAAIAVFEAPVPATADRIHQALEFVSKLQADGGTNMLAAFDLALKTPKTANTLGQIVFVTDGQIGNESDVLLRVRAGLDGQRLYTVGIGHAPNRHLMRKLSQAGRGDYTYIADIGEAQARMETLFDRIEQPLLTDLALQADPAFDLQPATLPDLFAGEPLVLSARLPVHASGQVKLLGILPDDLFAQDFAVDSYLDQPDAAVLWAKQKIDTHLDDLNFGADLAQTRQRVVALALEHQLLSPYTSFVAVDRSSTVPPPSRGRQWPQTDAGIFFRLVLGLIFGLTALAFWRRLRDD